jgi:hypothetical protein
MSGMHRLLPALILLVGCTPTVRDPAATLADGGASLMHHRAAMDQLQAIPRSDKAAIDALQGLVYRSGFELDIRRRGLDELLELDRAQVIQTLRRRLPRITDKPWLRLLCTWIAEQTWSPQERAVLETALCSSWGRPWTGGLPETQRPEYMALCAMTDEADLTSLVWAQLLAHNKATEEPFRHRCWDLLHRLGVRSQLVEWVQGVDPATETNPMLVDLHEAAVAFGTVPWNREEILWLRKLRSPQRRAFWTKAAAACASMPQSRRHELRIRDLPIAVAAKRHRPDLAGGRVGDIVADLEQRLHGVQHYREDDAYYQDGVFVSELLETHADSLSWGDAAAITLALDAMNVQPVVSHLFDYADRDNADTTTEYGGVLSLDGKGRYEVLEFKPRVRHHDLRFNAPQEMFDAGYTGLFHFHFHATSHRNREHAGPGFGDLQYADGTRANCLVMSFVDADTMNVDWYRHDGVVVDLGCMKRPLGPRTR